MTFWNYLFSSIAQFLDWLVINTAPANSMLTFKLDACEQMMISEIWWIRFQKVAA